MQPEGLRSSAEAPSFHKRRAARGTRIGACAERSTLAPLLLTRFWNRFWFELERFVVRGPLHRVVFIGVAIALISLIGGLIAVRIPSGGFENTGDAIWWAFLRLTDPGYLGDDRGAGLRTLSTIITVLGYVVFLGALIAIMTQWLNATMARLESGLTPIAANNHVVILGYSSRTAAIVRELLTSEARVARFLRARGAGRLKIVILANTVDMKTVQDLKDRLGPLWRPRQIVLRSGTPLRLDHLNRVDYQHAAAILLPSSDVEFGDATSIADGRTIKALLATSNREKGGGLPLVVAEIADGRRAEIAQRAYGGPSEILATDGLVARLIAQTLREPGITAVYEELLAPAGAHEIFVRSIPEAAGVPFWTAVWAFDRAIPIGVIRRMKGEVEAILAPPAGFVIESSDEMVFVARDFDDCEPSEKLKPSSAAGPRSEPPREVRPRRKVLVLGWSHKLPALVRELALDPSPDGPHQIDVFSTRSAAEREAIMKGDSPSACTVRHIEGDFASATELDAANPGSYDSVVFLASDRLGSAYESDARTILGHLLLEKLFETKPPAKRPSLVVELMSSENAELLGSQSSEKIVSPVIMSHILTQVALRRELHAVYVDLFGSGGGELLLRPASAYAIAEGEVAFSEIQSAATEVGEVALGVRRDGVVELCPDPKTRWKLADGDQIVAVARIT